MSQVIEYAPPTLAPQPSVLPRLDSLDLLRGFAILGILLMNSQCMSMPSGAYYNPTDWGDLSPLNYTTWIVIHILADTKFITTFSILFGAGILLQSQRVAARGLSAAGVHYRRMIILLLIGLIHAHVFWFGDILVAYAQCGMILYPLRKLRATLLILLGVLMIGMATFNAYATDQQIEPLNTIHGWTESITKNAGTGQVEAQHYRGGWLEQAQNRSRLSLDNETASFLDWSLWRCGGAMLIGMGLLRFRFFHADWPRQAYAFLAVFAIPVGWAITGVGVIYNHLNHWDWAYLLFIGEQFNYWGSLISALGYIALGTLLAIHVADPTSTFLRTMVIPIRAVGRTALSNYILQTVICTTIFYGHGFGWYGYVDRFHLLLITMAIWAFQLTVSTIYTRHFRQGPLEWIWHRIVYSGRARAGNPQMAV